MSAAEAVQLVKSGDRVFIHGSAATPVRLVHALLDRHAELREVELTAISTFGELGFDRPEVQGPFHLNALFVSANMRGMVDGPHGDYVPVFLSEIPRLFEKGILPLDVALVHVSPPDKHGYCSLGVSVDVARSAVRNARTVIAQVNPRMPRTLGDGHVHASRFAALVQVDDALPEVDYSAHIGPRERRIAELVSALVEDGSTLQMGIGAIPDAVLRFLGDHKDLGIHTEMFSDGVVPLVERGVITNARKKVERGKIVTTFVLGTRKVYDFVHDNPFVAFRDVSWVNDTSVIRKNPKVVAINSALQIDLTGQVCADSIGTFQYSGIGGQMDFMRGAALSEGASPSSPCASTTGRASLASCRTSIRAPAWSPRARTSTTWSPSMAWPTSTAATCSSARRRSSPSRRRSTAKDWSARTARASSGVEAMPRRAVQLWCMPTAYTGYVIELTRKVYTLCWA